MIFRILGAILLGGGALGAAAGWMTIRYLDARRQQIAQRVKRRSTSMLTATVDNSLTPPRDFAPGAVWHIPGDRRSIIEAHEQIQQWIEEEKKRRES